MHRCTHAKFLSFNVQPHKTHVRRCWPQGKRLSLCEAPGSSQFRGKEMMESSTTWWWLQFYKWQVNNHIIHVDFKPPSNIDSNLLYFQGYISKWCFHVKVMGRLGPWLPLWHLWPSLHTSHRCQQEGMVGATPTKPLRWIYTHNNNNKKKNTWSYNMYATSSKKQQLLSVLEVLQKWRTNGFGIPLQEARCEIFELYTPRRSTWKPIKIMV